MTVADVEKLLREYQREGLAHLLTRKKMCNWDDMGLGKTVTTLTAVKKQWENKEAPCNVLILCPRNALYVWESEIRKWYGEEVVIYTGTPAQRKKLWEKFLNSGSRYLITTYAMLLEIEAKTDKRHEKFIGNLNGWSAIIADEIHLAGLLNHKTATFQRFEKFARQVPIVYLLTGTPIRKGVIDTFAPLNIVDKIKFPSYWGFIGQHCITINTPFGKEIERRPRRPEAFREMLGQYVLRRVKKDVLPELPQKQRIPFYVQMTSTQRKHYDALVKDMFIVTKEEQVVMAPNAMVLLMRLRQLLVCPKILGIEDYGAAIMDIMETGKDLLDSAEPFVVFTPFKEAIPFLRQYIELYLRNVKVYELMGGMPATRFAESWQGFLENPNPRRILLCTIKSGASWNAYTAAKCFFLGYEEDFNSNAQAEDRLCRLGQKQFVLAYYVLHKNTVDEQVAQRLDDKQEASNWIIGTEEQFEALKQRYQMERKKNEVSG